MGANQQVGWTLNYPHQTLSVWETAVLSPRVSAIKHKLAHGITLVTPSWCKWETFPRPGTLTYTKITCPFWLMAPQILGVTLRSLCIYLRTPPLKYIFRFGIVQKILFLGYLLAILDSFFLTKKPTLDLPTIGLTWVGPPKLRSINLIWHI